MNIGIIKVLILAGVTLPPAFSALGVAMPLDPAASNMAPGSLVGDAGMLLENDNPQGVVDRLECLLVSGERLDAAQAEEALLLMMSARSEMADSRSLSLAERFLRDYPSSPSARLAWIVKGDWYFTKGKWSEALEAYKNVDLSTLSEDTRCLTSYREALCLIRCGFYPEARTLLRDLRGVKRYSLVAEYYDAWLDYADGNDARAMRGFDDVSRRIAADSREKRAGLVPNFYLCQLMFRQKDYAGCIKGVKALLRRPAELPDEWMRAETFRVYGLSQYALGDFASARGPLEEYVMAAEKKSSGVTDDALYALGVCEYDAGDYESAAGRFAGLSSATSAIGQGASLYLGQIEARRGNASAAALNFENAWRMNYDNNIAETALYDYVAARSKGGNIPFDSSVEMLESFVKSYPNSEYASNVERRIASLYYGRGEYEKALEAASSLGTAEKADRLLNQKILYAAGSAALSKGDPRRAVVLLRRCVELGDRQDPELTARARMWLGDACYAVKDYAGAERAYGAARSSRLLGNESALLDYDYAYALLMQHKYGKAAPYFSSAAEAKTGISPEMRRDAALRLADCRYYAGSYDDAMQDYGRLAADGDDDGYAAYRHAQLRGLKGDTAGKIRELRQLLDISSVSAARNEWTMYCLSELADTYASEGNERDAAPLYERLVREYPDSENSQRARAELERYNDEERERNAFENALAVLASSGDADITAVRDALSLLGQYADNVFTDRGAQSAVAIAEYELKAGNHAKAMELMEDFTASGSDRQYWVARGFIVLADAYTASGQDYLAKEYLRSLQRNYPGKEADIQREISKRLK